MKMAVNKGYPRNNMNQRTLSTFVRALPPTAFGMEPWQRQMLDQYKRLMLTDPSILQDTHPLPSSRRFSALEIAYAVRWIGKNEAYRWLEALYQAVFGFATDEAEASNRGIGLQI
jgi:hypothetical protein